MNYDAMKLAELRESKRHNLEAEEAERLKAKAAMHGAIAKMADTAVKGATGFAGLLHGKNDPEWGMTGDDSLDAAYDQSYVNLDLEQKRLANGIKIYSSVAIVDFVPVCGDVYGNGVSPLFLAVKRIYDICRGKNRGATNYTIANVAQYLLPPISMAAQVAFHELIVKLAHNPDLKKRVTIKLIFDALGLNYADFMEHLPDFELRIAKFKSVLAQFPIPADLPVLKRWIWLSSFAFLDKPDRNSSIFINRPKYYYHTGVAGPHTLCTTDTCVGSSAETNTMRSFADVMSSFDVMEARLAQMLSDNTLQAVAGDIINAFEGRMLDWGSLALDPNADPYYFDEEYLLEITNARIINSVAGKAYGMLALKYDKFGNFGQGLMDATGHFRPLVLEVESRYISSGAYGADEQVIFTDGHEKLDRGLTNLAISFIHAYGSTGGSFSQYYWDDTDPGNEFKTITISAGANNSLVMVTGYSTELVTSINVCRVSTTGIVQTHYVTSNEVDITGIIYTNAFNHFPWRWYNDNLSPLLVCVDLDSYGNASEGMIQNALRIKNQALWGYRTLTMTSKIGRGSSDYKHRGKNKGGKSGKAGKGSNPANEPNPAEPAK